MVIEYRCVLFVIPQQQRWWRHLLVLFTASLDFISFNSSFTGSFIKPEGLFFFESVEASCVSP